MKCHGRATLIFEAMLMSAGWRCSESDGSRRIYLDRWNDPFNLQIFGIISFLPSGPRAFDVLEALIVMETSSLG